MNHEQTNGRESEARPEPSHRAGSRPPGEGSDAAAVPPSPAGKSPAGLTEVEQKILLELARSAMGSAVRRAAEREIVAAAFSATLCEPRGCFVTLTAKGSLRGCIGQIVPHEPLYLAVMTFAANAALRDPRFEPVQPDELPRIDIGISVLSEPRPLKFTSAEELLGRLEPHRDGVLLRIGGRVATFLPQVWEQVPDKVEFLERLAQKAGCRPSAWRGPDASVSVYQAESFHEPTRHYV